MNLPESKLTDSQIKKYGPVLFDNENGAPCKIWAQVRHDDSCRNGHNSFSITGKLKEGRYPSVHGCIHSDIAKHFPELAPFIKWHLTGTDGPLHYIANTVYHASDRDHNGLRKGEEKPIFNRRTGEPVLEWMQVDTGERISSVSDAGKYSMGDEITLKCVQATCVGEGKERDLDAARRSAVWPDATDEDLTAPGLKERLMARLPALMTEFKKDVESLGFTY